MIKTNYEIIKGLVEKTSNCKDLSEKGQYKGLSLTRCVYYQLCYDYMGKDYVHIDAAKTIKKYHSGSIYGLKNFERFESQEFFHYYYDVYIECIRDLGKLETQVNKLIKELTY